MKFHRNLVLGIAEILSEIFTNGKYADDALEKKFKEREKWGARDRGFVAENVYEIVRWWRKICFVIDVPYEDYDQDYFKIAGVWFAIKNGSIPDWDEWKDIDIPKIKEKLQLANKIPEVKHSISDWIYDLGKRELREKWDIELEAMNKPAKVVLRANTLLTTPDELLEVLKSENVEVRKISEIYPHALELTRRKNIFQTEAFQNGLFEMQDANSQLVSLYLDPQPGMRVIDACAGAGGKTLHLAALMKNKGTIIALDTELKRLNELKKRLKRAKVDIVQVKHITSSKIIKRLYDSADRLLLDSPCTGLGTLKRNPDAKWKLQPEFYNRVTETQLFILKKYSKMLRKGGKMVYATCSLLPSENTVQVYKFLNSDEGKGFKLTNEMSLFPSETGYDGFYIAVLEKLDDIDSNDFKSENERDSDINFDILNDSEPFVNL